MTWRSALGGCSPLSPSCRPLLGHRGGVRVSETRGVIWESAKFQITFSLHLSKIKKHNGLECWSTRRGEVEISWKWLNPYFNAIITIKGYQLCSLVSMGLIFTCISSLHSHPVTPSYKQLILGSERPFFETYFILHFSLRLSGNNRSRVISMAKFGPAASNFDY